MPGPTTSDLIFSEQANHNFSKTLGDLKRSTLSIHNRLDSIVEDAKFAEDVAESYRRPLIANERCGSWYIDPAQKSGSAYFKSTDGHTGVWKFSLRRLNLHLLEVIGNNDGCIIIDSTRRGKRMPDALSKTIPIWCSVVNRYLFPAQNDCHDLYTPPQVVSASERAQISALLPIFLQSLQSLHIDLSIIRKHISKPLRPFWITPESRMDKVSSVYKDYHPVICCTVSRRVTGGEASEAGYIQGAGDDTENWAHGLTAQLFWEYREELFAISESDLPDFITRLIQHKDTFVTGILKVVRPTNNLFITELASLAEIDQCGATLVVLKSEQKAEVELVSASRLEVGLGAHKIGAKRLRLYLAQIADFISQQVTSQSSSMSGVRDSEGSDDQLVAESSTPSPMRIIVACESGTQTSIGVGLALICLFFDDDGSIVLPTGKRRPMTKDFIRKRLAWFSTSMPDANPSRDVLQSVNSFLMDYRPSR